MSFRRKLVTYMLIAPLLLIGVGVLLLYVLLRYEVSEMNPGIFWSAVFLMSTAIVLSIASAIYGAMKISEPVLRNAGLLHRLLFPEDGREPESGKRDFDEMFRMEAEIKEVASRLNSVPEGKDRGFISVIDRISVILDGVKEGIILLDRNFDIVYSNKAARRIMGTSEGTGNLLNLKGSENPEQVSQEVIDSDNRIFQPRLSPYATDSGKIDGYIIVFWDVTEEREFEESRRQFISTLSHQLKTPMTSLSMSVSLLREKLKDISPAESELINMAKSDCDALSSLITELIGASRDAAARLSLSFRREDLTDVLSKALRPFEMRAEQRGIKLKIEYSHPIFAEIDPVKFSWVVSNIAANAIRCTGAGGEITINMETTGDGAEVTIADTGPGISPENIGNLFKPFVSLDEQPEPDSMGLGLVIAREIVEAHKGMISVESELGKGTSFIIRLPLS